MRRAIVLVLDSLGVGAMADTAVVRPQDVRANTFRHLLDKAHYMEIPALEALGVNHILRHERLGQPKPLASYGKLKLMHEGADSYWGHQELMGTRPQAPVTAPFATHMEAVKKALQEKGHAVSVPDPAMPFLLVDGCVTVADNVETDYGQIYNVTGAFHSTGFQQVAEIAGVVRGLVDVSRVIALGGNIGVEQLLHSVERRDDGLVGVNCPKSGVYGPGYEVIHMGFGVDPEKQAPTMAVRAGLPVTLIGKMQDVITCAGARKIHAVETDRVMCRLLEAIQDQPAGLISATVQETDLSGHEQDVEKYACKVMTADAFLCRALQKLGEEDLLLITADHGNDPTIGHSRHTREEVFVLAYRKGQPARALGVGDTLSDVAATACAFLGLEPPENGKDLLGQSAMGEGTR